MTYKRKKVIGKATLYLGDSLSIIDGLENIDCLISDPPYGIEGGKGLSKKRGKGNYNNSFDDTPEYIENICVPIVEKCLKKVKRGAITPGNRCMFSYPKPNDIGIWYNPAAITRGAWGCASYNALINYYGKDPYNVGNGAPFTNSTSLFDRADKDIGHPCPKPLKFMKWLVGRCSLENETVIDPFMGSGTTGMACHYLGREFIGIELDEDYFNIACKRIEDAQRQGDFFV